MEKRLIHKTLWKVFKCPPKDVFQLFSLVSSSRSLSVSRKSFTIIM